MGHSQICGQSTNNNNNNFYQAERRAFDRVREALAAMPFAGRADLRQAAFSYLVQSLGAQGVAVREEWARGKAEKWASWWARKHQDRRRPGPHTRYSRAQAVRGHRVSRYRRGARADVDALRAQILRAEGVKVAEIAAEIDKTTQHTRRLLRRTFSKVLVLALVGTFAKSSMLSLPNFDGDRDQTELLANVPLGAERTPATPAARCIDEIEAIGAAIPEILKGYWAAQGL